MEQPAGNEPAESPPARAASDAEHHIGQTEANEKPEVQAAGRHVDKPEKTNDGLNKPRIRVETRAGGSRYWVRRPRALQYIRDGSFVQNARPAEADGAESDPGHVWTDRAKHRVATSLIPLPKQAEGPVVPVTRRRQLDIFLDLLWVGIVGNVADEFSENAFEKKGEFGHSFLEFLVLFLLAWQIWNYLRRFLNEYYVDDTVQRAFVIWILVLALAYGNNAPFFLKGYSHTVIAIFLVAKGSFLIMESVYSIVFIPELRRLFEVHSLLGIPAVGLNIGSIFAPWPARGAMIVSAVVWEGIVQSIIGSSLGDRLLRNHIKKAPDPDHFIERLENFFIIVLGYGIFTLLQKSPLGPGIGTDEGIGVLILMLYFFLFSIYFLGDGSKHYIHPIRRAWWGAELLLLIHLIMYGSILLLEVALATLIVNSGASATSSESEPSSTEAPVAVLNIRSSRPEEEIYALHSSKWTAAVSFATAVLSMTLMSLIRRPLDKPGTLRVHNRYVRLAPRVALCIIVLCLPLVVTQSAFAFVSTMMWLTVGVSFLEWGMAMEKGGGIFEPKAGLE